MRHEQATITVLAYIIGFTTALIGFGLNNQTNDTIQQATVTKAAVTQYVKNAEQSPEVVGVDPSAVHLDTEGLYIQTENTQKFISVPYTEGVEPGPGYHVSVDAFVLSEDGTTLHYCAKDVPGDSSCTRYAYNVLAHSVRVE